MERLTTSRNLIVVILLTIVTLGFYSWYLIYSFARETNIACKGDGRTTQGLLVYILLSIVTLGIYGIVWQCMWISRCNDFLSKNNKPQGLQISTYLLTIFLLGFLTLGIMYLVVLYKQLELQNSVNRTYNELNNL